MEIKEYTKERIPDVLQFERDLRVEEQFWGWEIDEKYISDVTKSFENPAFDHSVSLLAYLDGKVVGNCDIRFFGGLKTKHRANIGIALISEYWNQGIGTKMFEEMLRLAEEREDVLQVELEFIEGNARARHLYEKMGFRITGVQPNAIRLKDGTLLNSYYMVREIKR